MECIEWAACIHLLMDAVFMIMMLVLTNIGGIIFAPFWSYKFGPHKCDSFMKLTVEVVD
jgi:hypothetical protein